MSLGAVKQQATRQYTLNMLHNGSCEKLRYRFEPFDFDFPGAIALPFYQKLVHWEKVRVPQGGSISSNWDYGLMPGWRIKCSTDSGAVISYNPISSKTGFRVFSRDGGNVAVITFLKDCSIHIEQDIHPFVAFPLQPVTTAYSGYSVNGNVKVTQALNFGEEDENIRVAFSGTFGKYRRLVSILTCPGKMTKFLYKLTLEGSAGESAGVCGQHLTLGSYEVSLPYTPNPMDSEVGSGVVIGWEKDSPPLGYEFLDDDLLVYQSLWDSNSLNNVGDTFESGSPFGEQQLEQMNRIGTPNHNAHYVQNPFSTEDNVFTDADVVYDDETPFRFTEEARKGVRVRNIDFNDQGFWFGTSYARNPVLRHCTLLGFTCGLTWGAFGIGSSGKVSSDALLLMKEFSKASNLTYGLPCNPGRTVSTDSGFVDDWHQQHKHKIFDNDDDILPPYRGFKLCRKI